MCAHQLKPLPYVGGLFILSIILVVSCCPAYGLVRQIDLMMVYGTEANRPPSPKNGTCPTHFSHVNVECEIKENNDKSTWGLVGWDTSSLARSSARQGVVLEIPSTIWQQTANIMYGVCLRQGQDYEVVFSPRAKETRNLTIDPFRRVRIKTDRALTWEKTLALNDLESSHIVSTVAQSLAKEDLQGPSPKPNSRQDFQFQPSLQTSRARMLQVSQRTGTG